MLLKQAMLHDPLVGAVCDPDEIWQMVDEMLVTQAQWLPNYRKAIAGAQKRLIAVIDVSRGREFALPAGFAPGDASRGSRRKPA